MKKLISMVLSLVMALAAMAVCTIPAMADDVISPTATIAHDKKPNLSVNGSSSSTDITYTVDPNNPNKVTFEYHGDGTLVGWEDNLTDELGFVEGSDYEAVFNEDGTYTITFISEGAIDAWNDGLVSVNAIVVYDEDETNGNKTTTGKKDDSHKSPSTGAPTSAIAATVAVAGAGFAVLAATKKRDAE